MLEAIGGLGLFLLGMIIMTDGLRSLAGHAIRNALMRFTHTPLSGAITGATTTAILQSSSATTVAAVGFVGAGLMSFPAALGIIFGANIGTTITGWLVVLLGFKFKLGTIVLPIILIGVFLRLFGSNRVSKIGYAIAGFGLIFVGINYMQVGMAELQTILSLDTFTASTLISKLQLVVIGMAFTVITQSSSAGVAATLTALYAGEIQFEQAAALVVGMDVGTTIKAAIATIGGSVESRRTGFSHVIYNIFTAIGALLLITPYIALWESISPGVLSQQAETALVAFHSTFNILGVIIVLPFTNNFARFMQKIIPEKEPVYTRSLDNSILKEPAIAVTAIQSTINTILIDLLVYINRLLGDTHIKKHVSLARLQQAIDETLSYTDNIHLREEESAERERLTAMIHSLDHLQRLAKRCTETRRTNTIKKYSGLENDRREMIMCNTAIIQEISSNNWQDVTYHARTCSQQIESQVQPIRNTIMTNVATGQIGLPLANDYLEAIRWLDRVSDHIDRITYHLATGKTD